MLLRRHVHQPLPLERPAELLVRRAWPASRGDFHVQRALGERRDVLEDFPDEARVQQAFELDDAIKIIGV